MSVPRSVQRENTRLVDLTDVDPGEIMSRRAESLDE